MPTKKPRLIVTLEPALYEKVKSIAHANGTAMSLAARDLIQEACEDIEEWGLVAMARERLKNLDRKKLIPQEKVWKKFL